MIYHDGTDFRTVSLKKWSLRQLHCLACHQSGAPLRMILHVSCEFFLLISIISRVSTLCMVLFKGETKVKQRWNRRLPRIHSIHSIHSPPRRPDLSGPRTVPLGALIDGLCAVDHEVSMILIGILIINGFFNNHRSDVILIVIGNSDSH